MRTSVKYLLLLLTSLMLSTPSSASELDTSHYPFVVDPNKPSVFGLVGGIDARTAFNFKRAVSKYGAPSEIILDSPGGQVHEALLLALEISELGVRTTVKGECMSACFFIFMAGRERSIEGLLGVHQMSSENNDFSSGQLAIADILDVLGNLKVPTDVIVLMLQTPSDDIHVFSREEIARYGLETEGHTSERKSTTQQAIPTDTKDRAIAFAIRYNVLWSLENSAALYEMSRMYAHKVLFYGQQSTREGVMHEKNAFAGRWPQRKYKFNPDYEASYCSDAYNCTVVGVVDWYAHSPSRAKTSSGTASFELKLRKSGTSFVIYGESGVVLSRK